ncbi:MAG TPA: S41 family peptidase [Dyella sp.]|uniref:S41 family peptidase n=1 Tax=Dyella sp. TaxID=1869338 RepID=UPI002B9BCD6B|nr:S41 family peptidase [Dyella sp.]HUB89412.1 S41 family peptidase [Dyella sp.]
MTWKRKELFSPRWPPDGTRLAFLAEDPGSKQAQLFVMPMDGGDAMRITEAKEGVDAYAWSPDGAQIAFITEDQAPSFGDPKFEKDAIDFLKAHTHAKVIIFDVRGNGGGNSPDHLLQALITKPYRYWNQLSGMSIGLPKAYAGMVDHIDAKTDPQDHGFMDGMNAYFQRPMLYVPGELVKPSAAPIYMGKLIVLADQACASACEDFLMPLKVTGRAIIIGDVTFGSSG